VKYNERIGSLNDWSVPEAEVILGILNVCFGGVVYQGVTVASQFESIITGYSWRTLNLFTTEKSYVILGNCISVTLLI